MANTTQIKSEKTNLSSAENKKGIENHKLAATHFEAAAKNHRDAAKHQEEGNHDKASKSTVLAQSSNKLATECQKSCIK